MDQILRLKRDHFRVSIRSREINQQLNEKRKNSLGVSSIAHSLGFNSYDQ